MKIHRNILTSVVTAMLGIGLFLGSTAECVHAETKVLMPSSYDMNAAMPYINQTVSPYAYVQIPALSGDKSVCAKGCSVITYAMIEGYYQKISNDSTSAKAKLVKDVANRITSSDLGSGGNIKTSVFSSLASRYGRDSEPIDVSKNSTGLKSAAKNNIHYLTTEQKISLIQALGMGYPVGNPTHGKFSLVGGGHYMVWSGIDIHGNVYIHNANGRYSGQAFSIQELDECSNGNNTIVYPSSSALKLKDFSVVYDYKYYVKNNPKIKAAYGSGSESDQIQAAAHFFTTGIREGLQASPYFNIDDYMSENEDVASYFNNDREMCFRHYCFFGYGEGRVSISSAHASIFDPTYFLEQYPSVKKACGSDASKAMAYFRAHGMEWVMQGSANFNPQTYMLNYQDLRIAYGNKWEKYYEHYTLYGKREGRIATGTPNFRPITSYNGVDYSDVYDYHYYYDHNTDIQQAYDWKDDYGILRHFVTDGMKQGRVASANFNVHTYIEKNPSLKEIYGDKYPSIFMHYIWWGKAAGWEAV